MPWAHLWRETEAFYRELSTRGSVVRVGMEASGHGRWFERLLEELQFELWIGDAAEIRTKRVRKQKTDRQDAQLLLTLLLEDRFPRIWVPNWENRDLRQDGRLLLKERMPPLPRDDSSRSIVVLNHEDVPSVTRRLLVQGKTALSLAVELGL